jgi:hypothetical protein
MASQHAPPGPIPFLDNPAAPDVFATNATGFVNLGGAIGITFETLKVHHGEPAGALTRTVIGRVVMPIGGAQALAVGLYNFLAENNLTPNGRPKTSGDATASFQ